MPSSRANADRRSLSMSTRLRSRLFTFALAGVVLVWWCPRLGDEGTDLRDAHSAPEEEAPTKGERAVQVALKAVGVPYRWGGETPASGFDCSGLVRWAYGRVGIDLPHSSYALYGEGRACRRLTWSRATFSSSRASDTWASISDGAGWCTPHRRAGTSRSSDSVSRLRRAPDRCPPRRPDVEAPQPCLRTSCPTLRG